MAVAAKSARQEEEIRTYVSLWPSHILHPLPPQRQLHQHHHGRVVHKPSCYLDIVGGREMAGHGCSIQSIALADNPISVEMVLSRA